jgi:hypothetical protein
MEMIPECYWNEAIGVEIFVKKGEELWFVVSKGFETVGKKVVK